jgi:hypothetical protein
VVKQARELVRDRLEVRRHDLMVFDQMMKNVVRSGAHGEFPSQESNGY